MPLSAKRVVVALAVCSVAVSQLTAMAPARGAFTGANGRIAVTAPGGGIYLVNPDGTGKTFLREGYAGGWSPNGRKLALVHVTTTARIAVVNEDGSGFRTLTEESMHAVSTAWSPDGSEIAFVFEEDIWVIRSDGSAPARQVTDTSRPEYSPAWSPDGRRIAFTTLRNLSYDIYTMNADGTRWRRLTDSTDDEAIPDWSPDGSKIAYMRYAPGWRSDIYTMNADGTEQTNLMSTRDEREEHPAWSPDGRRIAFDKGRFSFHMAADGTDIVRITEGLGPKWQPLCTVEGTPGDDRLEGTPGNDLICGREGNDRIVGRGGNDVIFGGEGDDSIAGGRANDVVVGSSGSDVIEGGAGRDLLHARDEIGGNDSVDGGSGDDRCRVDEGDAVTGCP